MDIQLELVLIEHIFSGVFDGNNDLIVDQSIPFNNESLVDCEFLKDTEINSCLQNKGMYLFIFHNPYGNTTFLSI